MVFRSMNPFGRNASQETQAESSQYGDEPQVGDEEAPSSPSDRPGIAERVRFWEEQDRINRELIPRVLKQNELLSAHVASHEEVRVQATTMSARMDEMLERHKREMAELEARTSERIRSSNRMALVVSIVSAGIAALAVVLVLMA